METQTVSVEAIRMATDTLHQDLHIARRAVTRLQEQLTSHLADVALLGKPEDGQAEKLRGYIRQHQQIITEIPSVITELYAREAVLFEAQRSSTMTVSRARGDELFTKLLDRIVATATASPADLLQLRHYGSISNQRDRKYLVDNLEDALAEHDRKTKQAIAAGLKPPAFSFNKKEY